MAYPTKKSIINKIKENREKEDKERKNKKYSKVIKETNYKGNIDEAYTYTNSSWQ